jgi:hypothetical protein
MRRLASALASAFVAFLCGIGRPDAQSPNPAFQIDIVQDCEVVVPASCNGGVQQFTISGDGTWRATLRDASPARQGNLDRARLNELQSAVQQIAFAGTRQHDQCKPRPLPPQTLETISLQLAGSTIKLYGSGGKIDPICGAPGSPAARLFSAADGVMREVLSASK